MTGAVEEKSIVASRPKPAVQPLFEKATTREGSDVVLINEPSQTGNEPEAANLTLDDFRAYVKLKGIEGQRKETMWQVQ